MGKVTQAIMMRKTKAVLVDMLETQRQLVVEANIDRDKYISINRHETLHTTNLSQRLQKLEGKYEHLKQKHSDLSRELGRKDREIQQLKDAYIDKLELIVELYEGKV